MELQQLRYVLAVSKTGNFSRAALHCHVSQPSLSQQILKLEAELGERLFDRLKRTAKLTTHGQLFVARAARILQEVDAAQRDAKDAQELLRGKVTLGILPTIAPYLLPQVMRSFVKAHPGVEIIVQEDTTEGLLRMVLGCEIDFAIVSRPIRDERLDVVDLFTEELRLALPPGHPLLQKRAVSGSDLRGEQLIVMREGHCLGEQVLDFCDSRNLRPKISFRSAQLETVQSLVAAGFGISLVPAMATWHHRDGGPKYRSFAKPKPSRKVIAAWLKQHALGRAPTAFMHAVRQSSKTGPTSPGTASH